MSLKHHFRDPHWKFILRGSFWSALGQGVNRGSILVSGVVLARVLSTDEFGQYGILRSLLFVVVGIVSLGMSTIAMRAVGRLSDQEPAKAGRLVATTILFSVVSGALSLVVIALLSRWISSLQLGQPDFWPSVIAVGVNIFFAVQVGTLGGILLGFQELRFIGVSQFIAGIALIPIVWLGAVVAGVTGALIGMALSQVALTAGLAWRCRLALRARGLRLDWGGYRQEWRIIPQQGAPLMIASLLVSPAVLIVQSAIARGSGGLQDVAVFSLAFVWATVVTVPAGFVGQPNMSALVNSDGDRSRMMAIMVQGGTIQFGVAALTAVILAAAAPLIMAAHGAEYSRAVSVLWILLLGYIVTFIAGMADTAITALGSLWLVLIANVTWSAVFVALSLVWGVDHGPAGVAWCFVVAYAVKSLLQMLYLRYLLGKLQREAISSSEILQPSEGVS